MDDLEPPLGILGQHMLIREDPAEQAAERAARFSAQVGLMRQELRRQAAGFFQALSLMDDTRFAQKLYDFAIDNDLQFRNGDWQENAIRLAGRKYINELAGKKKRGRRPESLRQPAGLLQAGNREPVKGERDYYEVEAVMQALSEAEPEKLPKQIDACRIVAKQRGANHLDVIETKARAIEKSVGAYRRKQGLTLTAGRPKGLKSNIKRKIKYRKK